MSNRGDFPIYDTGQSIGAYDTPAADKRASCEAPYFPPDGTAEESGRQGFSSVLHELRAPLTAVLGFAGLMEGERAGRINATQRRYLRIILENSRRMLGALNSLSELTAKRGRRSELVDFGSLWRESVRLTRPRAAIKGVRIVERSHEERLMVSGDRDDLAFATHRFLANAVKATAAGGTIELALARESAEVTARITNPAAGDGEDAQSAMLGCGRWSGCPSQTKAESGPGEPAALGMPLVHDIIETHAGRIWSTGSADSGWTLALSLPAASREA